MNVIYKGKRVTREEAKELRARELRECDGCGKMCHDDDMVLTDEYEMCEECHGGPF